MEFFHRMMFTGNYRTFKCEPSSSFRDSTPCRVEYVWNFHQHRRCESEFLHVSWWCKLRNYNPGWAHIFAVKIKHGGQPIKHTLIHSNLEAKYLSNTLKALGGGHDQKDQKISGEVIGWKSGKQAFEFAFFLTSFPFRFWSPEELALRRAPATAASSAAQMAFRCAKRQGMAPRRVHRKGLWNRTGDKDQGPLANSKKICSPKNITQILMLDCWLLTGLGEFMNKPKSWEKWLAINFQPCCNLARGHTNATFGWLNFRLLGWKPATYKMGPYKL